MANAEWQSPSPASQSSAPPDPSQGALMIDVRKLNKFFGERHILKEIDFSVRRGECVAIIGPSGSGKSTLIRCINYLETPTTGEIIIDGKTLHGELSHRELSEIRRELGMVFYNFNLFPHKTVMDNITLAPIQVRKLSKADAQATARRLLAKVGLADKEDSYPGQLSGGQKQRVALARALAQGARVLLLDEPTSALDPETRDEVRKVLSEVVRRSGDGPRRKERRGSYSLP